MPAIDLNEDEVKLLRLALDDRMDLIGGARSMIEESVYSRKVTELLDLAGKLKRHLGL